MTCLANIRETRKDDKKRGTSRFDWKQDGVRMLMLAEMS